MVKKMALAIGFSLFGSFWVAFGIAGCDSVTNVTVIEAPEPVPAPTPAPTPAPGPVIGTPAPTPPPSPTPGSRPRVFSVPLPTTILSDGDNQVARWTVVGMAGKEMQILQMAVGFDFDVDDLSNIRLKDEMGFDLPPSVVEVRPCQTSNCTVDLYFVQEQLIPGDRRTYTLIAEIRGAAQGTHVSTRLLGRNFFVWQDGWGDGGTFYSGYDVVGFDDDITTQTLTR